MEGMIVGMDWSLLHFPEGVQRSAPPPALGHPPSRRECQRTMVSSDPTIMKIPHKFVWHLLQNLQRRRKRE